MKTLSLLLISSFITSAYATVPATGTSASQNSQSQQSQSGQSQSGQSKLDPTNSNNTGGTGANAGAGALVGIIAVGVGVSVVLSTIKLIIKISSRAAAEVAMNGEREKALNEIVVAYNAKGFHVTPQQVEEKIYAVMDEHSDSEASWNALFNDEESFSRQVFTKLTGETIQ